MLIDRSKMDYRRSAQSFVVRGNEILLTQEIQWKDNEWGFPGGQIEKGETPEQAALRELTEEFPKNTFKIKGQAKEPIKYDWPEEILEEDLKSKGWSFRGQIRDQFLAELNEQAILEVKADELKAYKWVLIKDLGDYLVFPMQLERTLKALADLGVLSVNT